IQLKSRIKEWHEAYARLRKGLPSQFYLSHVKFDAVSNRAIYSRQELQRFWTNTLWHLRAMRLWNIHPWKLATTFIKDLSLTTSFAYNFRTFSRNEYTPDRLNPY
ncbi:MAG: hypothetical protein GTO40_14915, partial [Deltaproteobacteria bacterium]|nr:hypothetical protein [Deltaproteobacteria bacterium]